jgi:hypothetical protein
MINHKKTLFVISLFAFVIILSGIVSAANATVCCEKTTSNLFCQNVPQNECNMAFRMTPSSCDSTSFCKPGVCYDSSKGDCARNTPKIACDAANGTWSEVMPASCSLGCCILGDQAAFVSLVKCKRLSASLGLITNYNSQTKDEVSCVLSVQNQDKGACVFESEFEKTCKFITRSECSSGTSVVNGTTVKGTFYKNKLCSAPELGTNCGMTTDTICLPGKDEVYFRDSCGNPANIYDSKMIGVPDYWTTLKTKAESCTLNSNNGNANVCGNCDYLAGTFCRDSKATGVSPSYGTNICANLNCKNTQNGNSYKHGESWCVNNDAGKLGVSNNAVGSRFYKHICVNGEEIVEQCADFRQEICIEDKIVTDKYGVFSQAACRVNRWQYCLAQKEKEDCENTDKGDCTWKEGTIMSTTSGASGACIAKDTPGIKFWSGDEAQNICFQGNAQCVVTFEKSLFGNEKCKTNCECLSDSWAKQRNDVCNSLGDCGSKINWLGDNGYKKEYNVTIK